MAEHVPVTSHRITVSEGLAWDLVALRHLNSGDVFTYAGVACMVTDEEAILEGYVRVINLTTGSVSAFDGERSVRPATDVVLSIRTAAKD